MFVIVIAALLISLNKNIYLTKIQLSLLLLMVIFYVTTNLILVAIFLNDLISVISNKII